MAKLVRHLLVGGQLLECGYDSHGSTTASGSSSENPYQFVGRVNDVTRL